MPEVSDVETPLVTVITVAFNSAAYIRDAIESVLTQDYQNVEYIIIDDCSTDNTWEIITEYRDDRIRAFRNDQNIGEYPNRNKGIDIATGKYLIFIDGDDMVLTHGIGYFVRQMEKYPEAPLAVQVTYLNNVILPVLLAPAEVLKNYFFGRINLLSSSFASNFFRTTMLKGQKLLTNLKCGDEEIRFRLAMQYPTLFVSGWVTWPRETPGSASTNISATARLQELLFLYDKTPYHGSIGKDILKDVEDLIKRMVIRQVLKLLFALKFNEAEAILTQKRVSLLEFAKYFSFKPTSTDILNQYSPVNPYKQNKAWK